jgi:thymidine kinase
VQATDEQLIAVEKFRTGRPLKIAAFAGAGKTTTLRMLAESRPSRGAYLAFNKSIATEAQEKFPKSVDCRTTHSIAFRAVMPSYQSMPKMTKTMLAKQLAEVMGYKSRIFRAAIRLDGVHQAHLVLNTVKRFCHSADLDFTAEHVPTYGRLLGAPADVVDEIKACCTACKATNKISELALDPSVLDPGSGALGERGRATGLGLVAD